MSGATHGGLKTRGLKILRLDLLAYGPFTGQSLDLSAGDEGLHVVYGPNEAGKSTALRALRALLFGIGHVTTDNHVHSNNDLRIGAELRLPGGESLYVIRRKGRVNTLRAADDATPVDGKTLEATLGHIDEHAFDARFGIDHHKLVAGGKEIAEGQGDVGQLLFAASAGIAHLSRLQTKLRDEAELLYKQRGQNPAINVAVRELSERSKQLRAMQLSASDWEQRERELADAKAELKNIEQVLIALNSQQQRLARLAAALPLASRRAEATAELDQVGEAPPIGDDFCQRRRDAAEQLRLATHERDKAERELASIDARLAELGPPAAILEHADAVDAVCGELSTHVKAAKDRVSLAAQQTQYSEQIERLIDRIGRASSGDETRIIVRTAERAKIEELGRQYHALEARREAAQRRRGPIERRLAESSALLAESAAGTDGDAIKRLLKRLQPLVVLEAQRAADASRLAADEQQLAIGVARLARWDRDLEALERLPVPADEAVERFEAELAAANACVDKAAQRRDEAAAEKQRIEQALSAQQAAGPIPSDADLAAARQQRDAAWRAVRGAIADEDMMAAATHAVQYEPLVVEADALADRLRRDAKVVAERASLENELGRKAEALTRDEEQVRLALEERDAARRRWAELWRACGIEPGEPREMLAWLAARRRLCELAAALRARRAEQLAVAQRLDEARQEAVTALDRAGGGRGDAGASPETLTQAVDALEAACERIESERKRRQEAEATRAQAARDLSELEDELRQVDAQLTEWRTAWAATAALLGHDETLTPAQAQAVLNELTAIENLLDKQKTCAGRIAGIDRDAEQYVARLLETAGRACGDLDLGHVSGEGLRGVEPLVAELGRRLVAAREASAERRKLLADRQRRRGELSAANDEAAIAATQMNDLCREARAASAEELPAIEDRWRRASDLRRKLADLDERLYEHAAGAPLSEFLGELATLDADALAAEQSQTAGRLKESGERRDVLREQIWSIERDIEANSGRGDAAAALAELQSLRAQLEEDVGRYARLRLASAVLRRAIERFRQNNEGELIRRANEIFSRLTCGAFAELKIDYDDQRPVLAAVRAAAGDAESNAESNAVGKSVGVAGMSDGTCDQLYLALRLASVEQYIDGHPPIPFIVDDVLQRFDDHRAAAALTALAELAKKTQVIFFTHHWHIVELAARHLAEGDYFVHELGGEARTALPARSKSAQAKEVAIMP